jgi:predicted deacylase
MPLSKSPHQLVIGETVVQPGTRLRIDLPLSRLPTGGVLQMPVEVLSGIHPGPRLFLSAAIHGDEINGIEAIRQILPLIDPKQLKGAVLAVPIVNVFGFMNQSRYLPDRRDLNRSFPGSKSGSQASQLAYFFMNEIVRHSTHGIDLHTASQHRINVPQIRVNLASHEAFRCAEAFGAPYIVNSAERDGSLRMAAAQDWRVPVIVYEAGEANRFNTRSIETAVQGILGVMNHLGMFTSKTPWRQKKPRSAPLLFKTSTWVRSTRSGLFRASVEPGQHVHKDQFIGFVADAFGEHLSSVRAHRDGVVIGLNLSPLVNRGDALVNIAVPANPI